MYNASVKCKQNVYPNASKVWVRGATTKTTAGKKERKKEKIALNE